jgi:large subunit ribosomal protein L23
MKSAYDVLQRPVLTEKSEFGKQRLIYSFLVDLDANKDSIKKAVESIFNVKVDSVRTIVVKGKMKKYKFISGVRKDRKKAMVTLKEGYRIEI